MANEEKLFCETCRKTYAAKDFFKSKNLEKYPSGHLNSCKKCTTMFVDIWDPETFTPILKECDVPYIPSEWQKLLVKDGQNSKSSGAALVGKYLGKMALKQHKDDRWKDTEYLQQVEDQKIIEAMLRQGYSRSEADQAVIANKTFKAPDNVLSLVKGEEVSSDTIGFNLEETPEQDYDLTEEDKTYLRLKWGKAYKPEEWVALEDLYTQMEESYDIQGAGQEDTLKMICKTSLKSNQLLDISDVDGAQKMIKMYDTLMKSAGLTAFQNKKKGEDAISSISEFVIMCEKEGFIPRFYIAQPNDRVDETIIDLQHYTNTLVTGDSNLGNLIENAVKSMALEVNKAEDEDNEDEEDEELLTYNDSNELTDQDFSDFSDFVENDSEDDENLIENLMKGVDFF